jgi:hypothetical protein
MASTKYKQTVIPKFGNQWDSFSQADLKKVAQKFFQEKLKGKTVKNIDTGVHIQLAQSGVKHALNYGQRDYIKFKVIGILDELLKYAEFKNFKKPDLNDGQNILGYMNFEAIGNVESKNYKFRIVVRITNEGKFYYHHAKKIR